MTGLYKHLTKKLKMRFRKNSTSLNNCLTNSVRERVERLVCRVPSNIMSTDDCKTINQNLKVELDLCKL